jgi:hypothetical protein
MSSAPHLFSIAGVGHRRPPRVHFEAEPLHVPGQNSDPMVVMMPVAPKNNNRNQENTI